MKGVRSFLGHTCFYRCFLKDFSKIIKPLCNLFAKENDIFYNACLNLSVIKENLTIAPIIIDFNGELPFALMCDTSDYVVGAVSGQRFEKFFHAVYCASKVLNENQVNYTITKKELLVVVFELEFILI